MGPILQMAAKGAVAAVDAKPVGAAGTVAQAGVDRVAGEIAGIALNALVDVAKGAFVEKEIAPGLVKAGVQTVCIWAVAAAGIAVAVACPPAAPWAAGACGGAFATIIAI